jgi:hypothetical protein
MSAIAHLFDIILMVLSCDLPTSDTVSTAMIWSPTASLPAACVNIIQCLSESALFNVCVSIVQYPSVSALFDICASTNPSVSTVYTMHARAFYRCGKCLRQQPCTSRERRVLPEIATVQRQRSTASTNTGRAWENYGQSLDFGSLCSFCCFSRFL